MDVERRYRTSRCLFLGGLACLVLSVVLAMLLNDGTGFLPPPESLVALLGGVALACLLGLASASLGLTVRRDRPRVLLWSVPVGLLSIATLAIGSFHLLDAL